MRSGDWGAAVCSSDLLVSARPVGNGSELPRFLRFDDLADRTPWRRWFRLTVAHPQQDLWIVGIAKNRRQFLAQFRSFDRRIEIGGRQFRNRSREQSALEGLACCHPIRLGIALCCQQGQDRSAFSESKLPLGGCIGRGKSTCNICCPLRSEEQTSELQSIMRI